MERIRFWRGGIEEKEVRCGETRDGGADRYSIRSQVMQLSAVYRANDIAKVTPFILRPRAVRMTPSTASCSGLERHFYCAKISKAVMRREASTNNLRHQRENDFKTIQGHAVPIYA